ncbi:MAG TPA: hypothetical protein VHH73_17370, partial [Verrucomicrobiae bacterium]|nr:hypothetical protein [Verrucomicrobiae bacterium]
MMNQSYRVLMSPAWLLAKMLLGLIVAFSCGIGNAATPGDVTPAAVGLRMDSDASGAISLALENRFIAALKDLPTAPKFLTNACTVLGRSADGALVIMADCLDVKVEIPAFGGLNVIIPQGNRGDLRLDVAGGLLDLVTSPTNSKPVRVTFIDGSTAQVSQDSRLRSDIYRDQSYALTGLGKVQVKRPDGAVVALSTSSLPVTGGPVVVALDAQPNSPLEHRLPTTQLQISGSVPGDVQIKAGNQVYKIEPGQTQKIVLPNGTELEFSQGLAADGLAWSVTKGDVRMSVGTNGSVKTVSTTGQRGRLIWNNQPGGTVEVRNTSSEGNVVVVPGDKDPVSVEAGGTLQVAVDPQGKDFALNWVQRGVEIGGAAVRLQFDATEGLMALAGNNLLASVKTLKGNPGQPTGTLWGAISLSQDGKGLVIDASKRDATVVLSGFNGWQATVPQGARLEMVVDPALRVLDIAMAAASRQVARIEMADGGLVQLNNGARLRYDIYADQSYALTGNGQVEVRRVDGTSVTLTTGGLPMTGGPLVMVKDPQGRSQTERLTPTTELRVSGTLGGALEIKAGDQTFKLGPGESRRLQLPNGTDLELAQDQPLAGLSWTVTKGDARLIIEAAPGAQTIAETGRRGRSIWGQPETTSGMVVENNSAAGNWLALSAGGTSPTGVEPGAVVELSRTATGEYALNCNRRGAGEGTTSLQLAPDPAGGYRVLVNGQVVAGNEALKRAGGVAGEWGRVAYGKEGRGVLIQASGSTLIGVQGMEDWQAFAPPGGQAVVTVNFSSRQIDLAAAARNTTNLTVSVREGSIAKVGPASMLRHELFADGSYLLTGKGTIEVRQNGGQPFALGANSLPVASGPLALVKDAQG